MLHFEKDGSLMVVLERGEKVVSSLTEVLIQKGIRGGSLSALGAVKDVELGYYYLEKKEYRRKTFTEEFELITLVGNVAVKEGSPFVHVHGVIGDDNFQTYGGHFFEAVTAVTVEISVQKFYFENTRLLDPAIGLHLINRCSLV